MTRNTDLHVSVLLHPLGTRSVTRLLRNCTLLLVRMPLLLHPISQTLRLPTRRPRRRPRGRKGRPPPETTANITSAARTTAKLIYIRLPRCYTLTAALLAERQSCRHRWCFHIRYRHPSWGSSRFVDNANERRRLRHNCRRWRRGTDEAAARRGAALQGPAADQAAGRRGRAQEAARLDAGRDEAGPRSQDGAQHPTGKAEGPERGARGQDQGVSSMSKFRRQPCSWTVTTIVQHMLDA